MLYGAYGDMGERIIREALSRGHRPVLAGRSAPKLRALAERTGLEWRAFAADAAHDHLNGIGLVLNLAGPYALTGEPLMAACIAAGAHYLDIANEIPAYQIMERFDAAARAQGVALIPGVGFGVVSTDMLSNYVAQKLPGAVDLHIAMLAQNERSSVGTTRTTFDVISRGGWARRDGRLVPMRIGSQRRDVPFPEGQRALILAPLGDLVTAYWSTHIPNITTYIETAPQTASLMGVVMPVLRQMLRIPAMRRRMERTEGPNAAPVPVPPSYVWVSAIDADGQQVQAWLQMGEGLAFTAASSVRAVEQTLGSGRCGALSPAMAFGVDFVLDIPGVTRMDTLQG